MIFGCTVTCIGDEAVKENHLLQPQQELDDLAKAFANNDVGSLEILYHPAEHIIGNTPEYIEHHFNYKVTINDPFLIYRNSGLIEALRSLRIDESDHGSDIKWAMIFYNKNGSRMNALYLDAWGKNGIWSGANDSLVSFKGTLFRWLVDNIGNCLK